MLSTLGSLVLTAVVATASTGDDPADAAPLPDKLEESLPDEELKDEPVKDEPVKDEALKGEALNDNQPAAGRRGERSPPADDPALRKPVEDDNGYTRRRKKPARTGDKRPPADRPGPEAIDDVGVVERYLPLTLSDPLVPELEDGWVWFVVGGLFAGWGGHLLLPLLAVTMQDEDGKAPEGYYTEAFKILIAHAIPHIVLFGVMACAMPLVLIPIAGPVLFILAWVLNVFVNLPLGFCNALWLTPVALANAYNRRSMAEQRAPRVPRGRRGRAPDRQAF